MKIQGIYISIGNYGCLLLCYLSEDCVKNGFIDETSARYLA